jgi:Predicted deacylase
MSDIDKSHQNNVALRSESVQEILGKVPHVLIRWGNTIILVLALGTLLISYFVRYPIILEGRMELVPKSNIEVVYAPVTGKLMGWDVKNGDMVDKGALLGTVITSDGSTDVELVSPREGRVYSSSFFVEGKVVKKGDLLFKISPLKTNGYQAFFKSGQSYANSIVEGQEVKIRIHEMDLQQNMGSEYEGRVIKTIYDDETFTAQIELRNMNDSIYMENIAKVSGSGYLAEIVVGNPRLIEHFFSSTTDIFRSFTKDK